jgi:hypothetical protein
MNLLNWLKIIETLIAVLAQLMATKSGGAAPAAQTDEIESVTNSIATLTALCQAHSKAAMEPPAAQAKAEAHEPYLKPLTGL